MRTIIQAKAVLVIVDRISFGDMEGPGFWRVDEGRLDRADEQQAVGSLQRMQGLCKHRKRGRSGGFASSVGALEVDHETMEMFYSRTGERVAPGMVVNPYINKLVSQNLNGEYGRLPEAWVTRCVGPDLRLPFWGMPTARITRCGGRCPSPWTRKA